MSVLSTSRSVMTQYNNLLQQCMQKCIQQSEFLIQSEHTIIDYLLFSGDNNRWHIVSTIVSTINNVHYLSKF